MTLKTNHLIQVTLIYIIIGLSGFLTWKYFPQENEILTFLLADAVMTVVCFLFSLLKKNSSVYDAYWSVIPFYFILQLGYIYFDQITVFHLITFFVVSLWSWRLTLNWVRSWSDFSHEDWRYVDLAKQTGAFYPIVNFLGIHLFPTLMVFGGMIPVFYMFNASLENAWFYHVGLLVSLIGIAFEFFADNQLAAFRKRPNPKTEELLSTGLWGRSRNPNYLGEILFWTGMYIVGLAYNAPMYITSIGALVMLCLFVFISIPMKEKRMMERRPGYLDYKKQVPMLFPKISK